LAVERVRDGPNAVSGRLGAGKRLELRKGTKRTVLWVHSFERVSRRKLKKNCAKFKNQPTAEKSCSRSLAAGEMFGEKKQKKNIQTT